MIKQEVVGDWVIRQCNSHDQTGSHGWLGSSICRKS